MQQMVGERLPNFTRAEVEMVKGSIDYVGINHYTSYYVLNPSWKKANVTDYHADWNAGFERTSFAICYATYFINTFGNLCYLTMH